MNARAADTEIQAGLLAGLGAAPAVGGARFGAGPQIDAAGVGRALSPREDCLTRPELPGGGQRTSWIASRFWHAACFWVGHATHVRCRP